VAGAELVRIELGSFLSGGSRRLALEVPAGTTVRDALSLAGVPEAEVWLVAVNGLRVEMDHPLAEGDEVMVFAPVGGG